LLVALLTVPVVAAGCGSGGKDDHKPIVSTSACRVGQTERGTRVQEEVARGIRPTTPQVVIGCGSLPREGRFKLISYRQTRGRGDGTILCIDVRYLALRGGSGACGFEPLRGDIEIGGTGGAGSSGLTLNGRASVRVARVSLSYRNGRRLRRQNAAFVRVADRDLLNKIELKDAFGYYLVDLPRGARSISVAAFDKSGRQIDRATPSVGLTGEGTPTRGPASPSEPPPPNARPKSTSKRGVVVVGHSAPDRRIASDFYNYVRRGCDARPVKLCDSFERVAAKNGVLTITTDLESTAANRRIARQICAVIQGSDVADFTEGHTVRGRGSTRLVTCPARRY